MSWFALEGEVSGTGTDMRVRNMAKLLVPISSEGLTGLETWKEKPEGVKLCG